MQQEPDGNIASHNFQETSQTNSNQTNISRTAENLSSDITSKHDAVVLLKGFLRIGHRTTRALVTSSDTHALLSASPLWCLQEHSSFRFVAYTTDHP